MFPPLTLFLWQEKTERDRADFASFKDKRDVTAKAVEAWHHRGISAVAVEQRRLARLNRAKLAEAVQRSQNVTRASVKSEDQHN